MLFPGSELEFGDVPVGTTTAYKGAPGGVYSYAAYRYGVGRSVVTQPVIDFVGESPMGAARFTYRLEFDSSRPRPSQIGLVEVTQD